MIFPQSHISLRSFPYHLCGIAWRQTELSFANSVPFFAADIAHYVRVNGYGWRARLNCYVRPLPLTYPVRQISSFEFRSKLPWGSVDSQSRRIDDQRTPPPSRPSPTDLLAAPSDPGSLNDDDNIARSEWPDDTRADTPRPCHWPARRMDGIRGFRRLAASLERPGRMRSCQDMRNPSDWSTLRESNARCNDHFPRSRCTTTSPFLPSMGDTWHSRRRSSPAFRS